MQFGIISLLVSLVGASPVQLITRQNGTVTQTCGGQTYSPNEYTCFAHIEFILCPIVNGTNGPVATIPCPRGDSSSIYDCYLPDQYQCNNSTLTAVPEASTTSTSNLNPIIIPIPVFPSTLIPGNTAAASLAPAMSGSSGPVPSSFVVITTTSAVSSSATVVVPVPASSTITTTTPVPASASASSTTTVAVVSSPASTSTTTAVVSSPASTTVVVVSPSISVSPSPTTVAVVSPPASTSTATVVAPSVSSSPVVVPVPATSSSTVAVVPVSTRAAAGSPTATVTVSSALV